MSIASKLEQINDQIKRAYNKRKEIEDDYQPPTLIAVSKLKPIESVLEAYNAGQRDFGENYIQELVEKSNNPIIIENCKDIKWHFIGHLQSNKSKKLINIPNLLSIQTIDSMKLADLINKDWNKEEKLNYFIQVNTSGEENKSGINPSDIINFLKQIQEKCSKLQFKGLMTIGALATSLQRDGNEDFDCLIECRRKISEEFKIDLKEIALSMGMSNDFEQAILKGSTHIRIGTSIFGERN